MKTPMAGPPLGKTDHVYMHPYMYLHRTVSAMQAVSDALCHNHSLTSLNLRWNALTPASLAIISKGLKKNESLISCDLSCNRLGGHHDHALNAWVR